MIEEIYAAREQNSFGISSRDLQKRINGAVFFRTLPQITEYLSSVVSSGDMVITVGAGDIYQVADMLVK